jgi:hypothetical protein
MLTTLMILSPDQGKIHKAAPYFDRCDEWRRSEIDLDPATKPSVTDRTLLLQRSPRWPPTGFVEFLRSMLPMR